MKLVFVYLGEKIPKYAYLNFLSTARKFPSCSVVLLVDHPFEFKEKSENVEIFHCKDPSMTWSTVRKTHSYSAKFRNDFWFKTLARFHSLSEFMKTSPNESILHIESDVWLSSRFPIELFENISHSLAYPLTNWDEGVASTLFVKNFAAMEKFIIFCEDEVALNPSSTDVTILGRFHQEYPDDVLILPTSPSQTMNYNAHVNENTRRAMSKYFNVFNGVFDASTWGQFLFGHDSRNRLGISPVYRHQEHHSISTKKVDFSFEIPDYLYIHTKEQVTPIYTLHIHSKNKNIFREVSDQKELQLAVLNYSSGVKFNFNLLHFLLNLPGYLSYRGKIFLRKIVRGE